MLRSISLDSVERAGRIQTDAGSCSPCDKVFLSQPALHIDQQVDPGTFTGDFDLVAEHLVDSPEQCRVLFPVKRPQTVDMLFVKALVYESGQRELVQSRHECVVSAVSTGIPGFRGAGGRVLQASGMIPLSVPALCGDLKLTAG